MTKIVGQFNDLFKMLLSVHKECNELLRDEEKQQDDERGILKETIIKKLF